MFEWLRVADRLGFAADGADTMGHSIDYSRIS